MGTRPQPAREPLVRDGPQTSWTDSRLVRACLAGDEEAWTAVIDKYKRLIYSIPLKYNLPPQEASDIFQEVCLELFSELANLRKAESLRSWLISVTIHKCLRWRKQQRRDVELDAPEQAEPETGATAAAEVLETLEREQSVREAIALLPPRCAEMIRLLFYQHPPLPYAEVARRLGLATGSIGFIRGRCLQRLQKALQTLGI